MNGGRGAAHVDPDQRGFARAERAGVVHEFFERDAADELHPQADLFLVPFGAVHMHHVRVANAREATRFLEQPLVGLRRWPFVVQQLERDLTLQLGVPRAEDVGRGAASDPIEQDQTPPSRAFGIVGTRTGGGFVLDERRERAIDARHAVDDPQVAHEPELASPYLRIGLYPVDLGAVGNGSRDVLHHPRGVSPQRPSPPLI